MLPNKGTQFLRKTELLAQCRNCDHPTVCTFFVDVNTVFKSVSSSEYNLTFCAPIRHQYNSLSNLYATIFTAASITIWYWFIRPNVTVKVVIAFAWFFGPLLGSTV